MCGMATAPPACNSPNSCAAFHLALQVRVHVCRAQGSRRHMQAWQPGKFRPAGVRLGRGHRAVSSQGPEAGPALVPVF